MIVDTVLFFQKEQLEMIVDTVLPVLSCFAHPTEIQAPAQPLTRGTSV